MQEPCRIFLRQGSCGRRSIKEPLLTMQRGEISEHSASPFCFYRKCSNAFRSGKDHAAIICGGALIDRLSNPDGDNDFAVGGDRPFFSKGRMAEKNKKIPFAKDDLFHPFYLSGRVINSVGWAFFPLCAVDFVRSRFFLAGGFLSPCQQQAALLLARLV